MNHVDIWYEMAEREIRLALILEDDVIFAPFFKEKVTRMIYAALDNNALRLNETCVEPKEKLISNNEWIYQYPMIVIGTCVLGSEQNLSVFSPPSLSAHKGQAARCSHAYLLTSCSAQALVDQIRAQKNDLMPADMLQDHLVFSSPVLQAFWMEPPIVYQGNKVTDLDNLETFKRTTHHETYKTVD
jgi:GR25 family glycosyltransferase involved in LPS biosynthesis